MKAKSYNNTIEIVDVTKTYGDHKAVDSLTFEVKPGEVFAFLGPNGAGKTTTLRMILDILKPDGGQIAVFGGPLTEEKKNLIGYMPEERGLYRNVPLQDLLVYLGSLKGMSAADARQRAAELLKRVGLEGYLKKKVTELSKGMQQKAQFVATILHRPELVIADEPFSGLDPVNTLALKELLLNLNEEGMTVIMSTHQMWQVEEMADRLVMIDQGKRVLYGPVDEVRSKFAKNAVVVEGEGDWAALPGVREVHQDDNGRSVTLYLNEQSRPDDVMRELAVSPTHNIRSFALAVPSLNDIFIEVAGGNGRA